MVEPKALIILMMHSTHHKVLTKTCITMQVLEKSTNVWLTHNQKKIEHEYDVGS